MPLLRNAAGSRWGSGSGRRSNTPVVGKSLRSAGTTSTLRSRMPILSTARFVARPTKYKYLPSADQLGKPAVNCVRPDHFRVGDRARGYRRSLPTWPQCIVRRVTSVEEVISLGLSEGWRFRGLSSRAHRITEDSRIHAASEDNLAAVEATSWGHFEDRDHGASIAPGPPPSRETAHTLKGCAEMVTRLSTSKVAFKVPAVEDDALAVRRPTRQPCIHLSIAEALTLGPVHLASPEEAVGIGHVCHPIAILREMKRIPPRFLERKGRNSADFAS